MMIAKVLSHFRAASFSPQLHHLVTVLCRGASVAASNGHLGNKPAAPQSEWPQLETAKTSVPASSGAGTNMPRAGSDGDNSAQATRRVSNGDSSESETAETVGNDSSNRESGVGGETESRREGSSEQCEESSASISDKNGGGLPRQRSADQVPIFRPHVLGDANHLNTSLSRARSLNGLTRWISLNEHLMDAANCTSAFNSFVRLLTAAEKKRAQKAEAARADEEEGENGEEGEERTWIHINSFPTRFQAEFSRREVVKARLEDLRDLIGYSCLLQLHFLSPSQASRILVRQVHLRPCMFQRPPGRFPQCSPAECIRSLAAERMHVAWLGVAVNPVLALTLLQQLARSGGDCCSTDVSRVSRAFTLLRTDAGLQQPQLALALAGSYARVLLQVEEGAVGGFATRDLVETLNGMAVLWKQTPERQGMSSALRSGAIDADAEVAAVVLQDDSTWAAVLQLMQRIVVELQARQLSVADLLTTCQALPKCRMYHDQHAERCRALGERLLAEVSVQTKGVSTEGVCVTQRHVLHQLGSHATFLPEPALVSPLAQLLLRSGLQRLSHTELARAAWYLAVLGHDEPAVWRGISVQLALRSQAKFKPSSLCDLLKADRVRHRAQQVPAEAAGPSLSLAVCAQLRLQGLLRMSRQQHSQQKAPPQSTFQLPFQLRQHAFWAVNRWYDSAMQLDNAVVAMNWLHQRVAAILDELQELQVIQVEACVPLLDATVIANFFIHFTDNTSTVLLLDGVKTLTYELANGRVLGPSGFALAEQRLLEADRFRVARLNVEQWKDAQQLASSDGTLGSDVQREELRTENERRVVLAAIEDHLAAALQAVPPAGWQD